MCTYIFKRMASLQNRKQIGLSAFEIFLVKAIVDSACTNLAQCIPLCQIAPMLHLPLTQCTMLVGGGLPISKSK